MKKRFITLQYLRAFCCVTVVLTHAGLHFGNPIPFGEGRVALFFVMSGFVLWWVTAGRETIPFEFVVRRLVRLVPTYWLVTLIVVGVSWAGVSRSPAISIDDVVKSLTFIPYGTGWHGQFYPALKPGWTLSYEMAFCVLLAATLPLRVGPRFTVLTAILGTLGLAGLLLHPTGPVLETLTGFPMLELLTGIWVAQYLRHLVLPRTVCWSLVIVGVFASFAIPLFVGDSHEIVATAPRTLFSALLILVGGLGLERDEDTPNRFFGYIGDAAYSIYIWHWPIMTLLVTVLSALHVKMVSEIGIPLATLLSIGIGSLMYEIFEKAATRILLSKVEKWKRPNLLRAQTVRPRLS